MHSVWVGGDAMAVVKSNTKQLELLARLMRSEAEGEGELGMLMVGNVGVNRVRAACLDFKDIRTLEEMVFQSPGGFEATQKSYFYQSAREQDKKLAQRVINGERFHPATRSLWFLNQQENVLHNGITNRIQAVLNHIASSHLLLQIVPKYKFERMFEWFNIIGTLEVTLNSSKCNNL